MRRRGVGDSRWTEAPSRVTEDGEVGVARSGDGGEPRHGVPAAQLRSTGAAPRRHTWERRRGNRASAPKTAPSSVHTDPVSKNGVSCGTSCTYLFAVVVSCVSVRTKFAETKILDANGHLSL